MNKGKAQERHVALFLAATDEVVSAVIELHKPVPVWPTDYAECHGCDRGDYAEGPAEWPCTTVMKINEYLHVEGIEQ